MYTHTFYVNERCFQLTKHSNVQIYENKCVFTSDYQNSMETSQSSNAMIPNKQPLNSFAAVVNNIEKVALKNQNLDRESKGCCSVFFYVSAFSCFDITRQITGYGMIYFNNHQYPVAPSGIIAVAEIIKLVIFLWLLFREGILMRVKISLLYFIPSLVNALNNNIYFLAMNYTTPPVWNLLMQLRVIFTSLTYRIVFGRKLSIIKWIALCILMIAVILPMFDEFRPRRNPSSSDQKFPGLIAITLAVVASLLATLGSLHTEVNN